MKSSGAVDAVPCRVAFERDEEPKISYPALSSGMPGWVVLADPDHGIVRVAAPLAGCKVRNHLHCLLL